MPWQETLYYAALFLVAITAIFAYLMRYPWEDEE